MVDRKKKKSQIALYCIAILIPSFLWLDSIQSVKYVAIQREIKELEKRETKLIEQNKTLIAELSTLSATSRIEDIAVNKLSMRKATSNEIMRVEVGR